MMNERIKELALQAGFNHMGIWNTIGIWEYHEKFAELIVKDCLDMIYNNNIEDGDRALGAVADMISKHFGVE